METPETALEARRGAEDKAILSQERAVESLHLSRCICITSSSGTSISRRISRIWALQTGP